MEKRICRIGRLSGAGLAGRVSRINFETRAAVTPFKRILSALEGTGRNQFVAIGKPPPEPEKTLPRKRILPDVPPGKPARGMTSESSPVTPADLVRRAVREFETPLVGYAASITCDHDAARDVVQDTFLKLYTQDDPSRLDGPGLKSWLFTVCRNRALDWLRRRKRLVSLDASPVDFLAASEPGPHDAAADGDETSEILRFFHRLPDNQAECLRLKFQNDLSYREISVMTGLSVSNVGFLIHTGLKRLRQLLSHQTGGAHEPAIRSTPLCAAPHCS